MLQLGCLILLAELTYLLFALSHLLLKLLMLQLDTLILLAELTYLFLTLNQLLLQLLQTFLFLI